MSSNKSYLGDSVYIDINEYGQIELTTEDGISISNNIILELEVLDLLNKWVDKMVKEGKL